MGFISPVLRLLLTLLALAAAGGDQGANEGRTFFQLASDNSAAVVQRFLALWTPPR